jgi:ABC-type transporter Mla MlaB component
MPFEMHTSDAESTLTLSGRLGVQQARALWEASQAATTEQRPLLVQAGDVEDLDTSIAQILCRIASQPGQLRIGASSDGFLLALARRGLDKFFIHAADSQATEQPASIAAEDEVDVIAQKHTGQNDMEQQQNGMEQQRNEAKTTKSSKGKKSRG